MFILLFDSELRSIDILNNQLIFKINWIRLLVFTYFSKWDKILFSLFKILIFNKINSYTFKINNYLR